VISAALVIVVVGTLWLKGTNWGREVTNAEVWVVDAGSGLSEGNPVVYLGVPIGKISFIRVDSATSAFVRIGLELEGPVVIPPDGRAVISPKSLFGDWQMEIVTPERFPRGAFYPVEPGYRENGVRVIGGFALPDLSRLTETAGEISQSLSVLTDRFDRAFSEETADQLSDAIRNVGEMTNDIKTLIDQQAATFDRVSVQVERAAGDISAAATEGRTTMERFGDILSRGEIDSILVNAQTASRSLNQLATDLNQSKAKFDLVLASADTTFRSINRLTARIERGEGSIGRLMMDNTLALRAESAMTQLEALFLDVKANPSRYIRLSIF
jgi:ABC-type transporter Mla subunit MlaD